MNRDQVEALVAGIQLPKSNVYYEASSADGFAFLGAARARLGLDCSSELEAIEDRDFCLNAAQTINKTQTRLPADTQYVYTLWACCELVREIAHSRHLGRVMSTLESIGSYPDGMARYCTHEIRYKVPNVTSAAASLFAFAGNIDRAEALVALLRARQRGGNWSYSVQGPGGWKASGVEDSHHLAMMIYQLRQVQMACGVPTADIVGLALAELKRINSPRIAANVVGWSIPMVHAATMGLDNDLAARSLRATLRTSIRHPNFRVRALSAWALTRWL